MGMMSFISDDSRGSVVIIYRDHIPWISTSNGSTKHWHRRLLFRDLGRRELRHPSRERTDGLAGVSQFSNGRTDMSNAKLLLLVDELGIFGWLVGELYVYYPLHWQFQESNRDIAIINSRNLKRRPSGGWNGLFTDIHSIPHNEQLLGDFGDSHFSRGLLPWQSWILEDTGRWMCLKMGSLRTNNGNWGYMFSSRVYLLSAMNRPVKLSNQG